MVESRLISSTKAWLREGRFHAICQLAFRYLDIDDDGVLGVKELGDWHLLHIHLSPKSFVASVVFDLMSKTCLYYHLQMVFQDLVKHIKEDNAPYVASNWVNNWGDAKGLSAPKPERTSQAKMICFPSFSKIDNMKIYEIN